MFCSTCMPFCLAVRVLRQEVVSPPLLTSVIRIFLPPGLGCCLSRWPHSSIGSPTARARQALPWSRHILSAASPCSWAARPRPSPTAAFSSVLLPASPNLKHNYPAPPVPDSVWWLWPIICTAQEETGKNHLWKQTDFACCHQKGYSLQSLKVLVDQFLCMGK